MWGWFKKKGEAQAPPVVKVEEALEVLEDKAESKKSTRKFKLDSGVTHIKFEPEGPPNRPRDLDHIEDH